MIQPARFLVASRKGKLRKMRSNTARTL